MISHTLSEEPLRKALAGFFFSFQGIKGCSIHIAAAATMVHAAASSQGYSLQVRDRQSLIVGIGLTSKEKEDIASNSAAAATGKLPVRLLLYSQLEELRNDEWTGLLSIVVALLCFDPNREQQFEKARTALKEARLDNFTKASEDLAHVRSSCKMPILPLERSLSRTTIYSKWSGRNCPGRFNLRSIAF